MLVHMSVDRPAMPCSYAEPAAPPSGGFPVVTTVPKPRGKRVAISLMLPGKDYDENSLKVGSRKSCLATHTVSQGPPAELAAGARLWGKVSKSIFNHWPCWQIMWYYEMLSCCLTLEKGRVNLVLWLFYFRPTKSCALQHVLP